jgi:nuclear transport factor 2 (NTF2) superfamily protein
MSETRPPLPPFTHDTATKKVRGAEDGWNSCNPERVSLAYTVDSYVDTRGSLTPPMKLSNVLILQLE